MKAPEVGSLPSKSIEEFMSKDIIKPLQRKPLYNPINRPLLKTWALQTNKNCSIEENLPKKQQYKTSHLSVLLVCIRGSFKKNRPRSF